MQRKISIIQRLIRQLKKLPNQDYEKLDELKARAKMIISNVFGNSSHYLEDLKIIQFRDPIPIPDPFLQFPPVYPDHKAYWLRGMKQMQTMFNTMLEDLRLSGTGSLHKEDKSSVLKGNKVRGNKMFISHSEKDSKIAEYFIEDILVGALNINNNNIFCTSADGHKIESCEDWRNAIRKALNQSKIVFLIITSNYKSSEICLNEMGAAWALCDEVIPVVLAPINYENVGVLNEVKQIEILNNEHGLARIKDKILPILGISAEEIKSDKWAKKKNDFISKTDEYIKNNPFPYPRSEIDIRRLEVDFKKVNDKLVFCEKEREKDKYIIEKLIKLKDKEEVGKIMDAREGAADDYSKFKKIIKETVENLRPFGRGIKKIIFSDYCGKDIPVDWQNDKDEIQEAQARNYLDVDYNGECQIKWDKTDCMKKLYEALQMLDKFMSKKKSSIFISRFKKEYKNCPFVLRDLTFWEKVFYI